MDLFENDANEPVIPGECDEGIETPSELMDCNIVDAISGEQVKSVIIPEASGIEVPNYVIDLSNIDSIYEYQTTALDAMLSPDGDTPIYAVTSGGIVRLGFGDGNKIEQIFAIAINRVFSGECKVYKDFQSGKPAKSISEKQLTTMRLKI